MKNYVHVHENKGKKSPFADSTLPLLLLLDFALNIFHSREFYLFSKCSLLFASKWATRWSREILKFCLDCEPALIERNSSHFRCRKSLMLLNTLMEKFYNSEKGKFLELSRVQQTVSLRIRFRFSFPFPSCYSNLVSRALNKKKSDRKINMFHHQFRWKTNPTQHVPRHSLGW